MFAEYTIKKRLTSKLTQTFCCCRYIGSSYGTNTERRSFFLTIRNRQVRLEELILKKASKMNTS